MQDISLEQAIAVLLEHTKKIEDSEDVPLLEALGRVMAEDAVASFDNPPFDRSPLDGYAFAASGTKGATKEAPAAFPIIGEECAGDFFAQTVPAGAAVRLMTGAAIPAGCDCVVRQEDVTVQEGTIFVPCELHHHENYCFAGEDIHKGTLAVKQGTRLTAAHLGVLASLGFGTVRVYRRPRIAIASTGDELVLPGEPLRPGKIYNSNLYTLAGRLRELGFEPQVLGILPDDAEQAAAVIAGLRAKADLVLTTGGVSVGKKDIMHEVVRRIGTRLFWRVCLKPGAPVIAYTGRAACSASRCRAIPSLPMRPSSSWCVQYSQRSQAAVKSRSVRLRAFLLMRSRSRAADGASSARIMHKACSRFPRSTTRDRSFPQSAAMR